MKKIKIFILIGLTLSFIINPISKWTYPSIITPTTVHAEVHGDDYPSQWKQGWGLIIGACI
ncbi:hypothetical protein N1496_05350 [Streptococcus didelphis]|uniref:Bacteriocin n=1 Tax=Streptococcus didelphis TaxID=102886 RepID=A0ABY9LFB7_9STRE|nr:hypothetical protein [Streptococcus didelphis]WMB27609.1 hypothetical protein N1496_05350 [Streptococcus didelphis]